MTEDEQEALSVRPVIDATKAVWAGAQSERERQAVDWQPIETAPRDGTPILIRHELYWPCWPEPMLSNMKELKHGQHIHEGVMSCISVAASDDDAEIEWLMCNIEFCELPGTPTHWMPLPDPPA